MKIAIHHVTNSLPPIKQNPAFSLRRVEVSPDCSLTSLCNGHQWKVIFPNKLKPFQSVRVMARVHAVRHCSSNSYWLFLPLPGSGGTKEFACESCPTFPPKSASDYNLSCSLLPCVPVWGFLDMANSGDHLYNKALDISAQNEQEPFPEIKVRY